MHRQGGTAAWKRVGSRRDGGAGSAAGAEEGPSEGACYERYTRWLPVGLTPERESIAHLTAWGRCTVLALRACASSLAPSSAARDAAASWRAHATAARRRAHRRRPVASCADAERTLASRHCHRVSSSEIIVRMLHPCRIHIDLKWLGVPIAAEAGRTPAVRCCSGRGRSAAAPRCTSVTLPRKRSCPARLASDERMASS